MVEQIIMINNNKNAFQLNELGTCGASLVSPEQSVLSKCRTNGLHDCVNGQRGEWVGGGWVSE